MPGTLRLLRPNVPRSDRNAMEFSIFIVLAAASVRTALGLEPLPGSLNASPGIFGQLCAIGICLGSVIAVVGLCWKSYDDGLLIEQFGLAIVGFACLFYGIALFISQQPLPPGAPPLVPGDRDWMLSKSVAITTGAFPFGMALGIFAGSVWRYIQIQRYVTLRKREAHEVT
jgi:hypothetical protein